MPRTRIQTNEARTMSLTFMIGAVIAATILYLFIKMNKKPKFKNKWEAESYWRHQGELRAQRDYRARRW